MAERRKSYAEQLKDVRWQKKRLEILERDGWQCQRCFREDHEQLHVHHMYYARGVMAWEYPNWSMIALCVDCHSQAQDDLEAAHMYIAWAGDGNLEFIRGYALGCGLRYLASPAEYPISSAAEGTGIADAFHLPFTVLHQLYNSGEKFSRSKLEAIKSALELEREREILAKANLQQLIPSAPFLGF